MPPRADKNIRLRQFTTLDMGVVVRKRDGGQSQDCPGVQPVCLERFAAKPRALRGRDLGLNKASSAKDLRMQASRYCSFVIVPMIQPLGISCWRWRSN